jgi:hypothetical protein
LTGKSLNYNTDSIINHRICRLLGFAPGTDPTNRLIQQLAEQGAISAPILTFKLPPIDEPSQVGELLLGDPEALLSNATRVTQSNATIDGFWNLRISVNVEGRTLVLSNMTNSTVIARSAPGSVPL